MANYNININEINVNGANIEAETSGEALERVYSLLDELAAALNAKIDYDVEIDDEDGLTIYFPF